MMTEKIIDDDIYSGYDNYSSIYDPKDFAQDEVFQEALKSSSRRSLIMTPKTSGSAMRLGTSTGYHRGSITGRLSSAGPRPMTALRAAGYTSSSRQVFDPLNMGSNSRGSAPPLESEKENTPEEKIKVAEKQIMKLIESSIEAACEKNMTVALERAKEASAKERALIRLQEYVSGFGDNHNLDLTFTILFNLASQYENNELYTEAIATYQAITRNKTFNNSARLKMNMGNIYLKMGQLPQAVKMYRMALDQAPTAYKDLRIKIMHNIGMLFVQMGRLEEAANSFEWVMREKAEFKAGLHSILCHYALSHRDRMKRGFLELLEIQLNIYDEDKYGLSTDDIAGNILNDVIKNDQLSKLERELKQEAEKTILNAANLIAPVIEDTLMAGFAWCVDTIKSSAYSFLAADLEISKAMVFLQNRETQLAIDTLKVFENREIKVVSSASTLLSFIYFLQGDYDQAEKSGEIGRRADTYSAAAYVNLSACAIKKGELEKARELLMCAVEIDAAHVQALYNLGLVYKKQGMFEEALECFYKLRSIIHYDPETLFQIGHVYQLLGNFDQASEFYNQLLSIIPSDPGVLQKLGELYDSVDEKQQAYQYYSDVAEKAMIYFERAVELAPDEPRWRLLVAACMRRAGQFHKALSEYQNIHKLFPENTDCLKFLVRLCSDLGLKEAQTYALELRKVERSKETRERHGSGRPGTTNSKRSNSGYSSRGGSGMSILSDNRTSPAPSRADFRVNSGEITKALNDSSTRINSSYSDPIGALPIRPMTAAGKRDDDFGDEELGDDLLPE